MKIHILRQEQVLPISLDEAWGFFGSPRNLDAITPPDIGFRIVECDDGPMYEGQLIVYRIQLAPLVWVRWVTELKAVAPRHSFIDEQRFGPYRFWHHRHSFEEVPGGTRMTDLVHYALPFGPLGTLAHALFVRRKLEAIFRFRREVLIRRFGGREV